MKTSMTMAEAWAKYKTGFKGGPNFKEPLKMPPFTIVDAVPSENLTQRMGMYPNMSSRPKPVDTWPK